MGPKDGSIPGADNQFHPGLNHLGNLNPFQPGMGVGCSAIVDDGLVGFDHLFLVHEIQGNSTDVAFVKNVLGNDLHHHRITHLLRRRNRLLKMMGNKAGGNGNACGLHDLLPLVGEEEVPFLFLHLLDHLLNLSVHRVKTGSILTGGSFR